MALDLHAADRSTSQHALYSGDVFVPREGVLGSWALRGWRPHDALHRGTNTSPDLYG